MKSYLEKELLAVLSDMGCSDTVVINFEKPNNPDHGDLATSVALRLARQLRRAPKQIAEEIAERIHLDWNRISSVKVAGPGFLNFTFSAGYLTEQVADLLTAGPSFGRTEGGKGQRALVEFVSANPTGPLTVGHGRNAVLGDTLAILLEWMGYDVTREYYFNDAGRQMRVLGASVRARYMAIVDPNGPVKELEQDAQTVTVPESFPDDGYLGDYIINIARGLVDKHGDALAAESDIGPFTKAAEEAIFAEIAATLRRLNIKMDTFFNEHALYASGSVWGVVDSLRERGYVYEKDGAVWFETTKLGKDKDTVLVKSTGEPTYRLPDIAYHIDKCERGYDLMIDVFGADHIATFPDVMNAVRLLGHDETKVDIVIYQFVTLMRGGEQVKMSTRKATYETLDDLMDEVGEDVTRYFFLMRSPNTHLEFDLDLAKEASEKNPVFYLQYAHARICSILRKAEEVGFAFGATPNLSLLTHDAEVGLMKVLLRLPEVLRGAADAREPHRVANYLREVAVAFTQFYGQCRIIGEEPALATARMHLAGAARVVLRNGLTALGISAPEKM